MSFPIADCASHPNCTSCLGNGNPLCGWCVLEDKCSKISECQNSANRTRWVKAAGTKTDQCPSISVIPKQYVVDNPMSVSSCTDYVIVVQIVHNVCDSVVMYNLVVRISVCSFMFVIQLTNVMSRCCSHLQPMNDRALG